MRRTPSLSRSTDAPIVVIGYIESTQTVAGTWAAAPNKIHVSRIGDLKTGDEVQIVRYELGTSYTTTSQSAVDITNSTVGITPISSCNPIRVQYQWFGQGRASTSNNPVSNIGQVLRVSPLNTMASGQASGGAGSGGNGRSDIWFNFDLWDIPQTGGVQTQYKARHYGQFYTTTTTYASGQKHKLTEIFV